MRTISVRVQVHLEGLLTPSVKKVVVTSVRFKRSRDKTKVDSPIAPTERKVISRSDPERENKGEMPRMNK